MKIQTTMIDSTPEVSFYEEGAVPQLEDVAPSTDVAQDPNDFRTAVIEAQRRGSKYVQVSDKLFKHLVAKEDMDAFTYGHPAVTVVREGKVEEFERKLSLSTDEFHRQYQGKK